MTGDSTRVASLQQARSYLHHADPVLARLIDDRPVLAVAEKWRPYRSLATSYLVSAAFERAEAPPVTPRETYRLGQPVPSRWPRSRGCPGRLSNPELSTLTV